MNANANANTTAKQPQAAVEMSKPNLLFPARGTLTFVVDVMNPAPPASKQAHIEHEHQHKASRLRGGGAAKVCIEPGLSPTKR